MRSIKLFITALIVALCATLATPASAQAVDYSRLVRNTGQTSLGVSFTNGGPMSILYIGQQKWGQQGYYIGPGWCARVTHGGNDGDGNIWWSGLGVYNTYVGAGWHYVPYYSFLAIWSYRC